MRTRPVRPNIYLPVVRFGVADSDWLSVLLISCAAYLLPIPFGFTVLYVPLQMWTWLLATAGSIAFFNYIRIGRKPYWLLHKLKALVGHHRQYRAIPNGRKRGFDRSWLIEIDSDQPLANVREDFAESVNGPARIGLLLENNNWCQKANRESWYVSLPTT